MEKWLFEQRWSVMLGKKGAIQVALLIVIALVADVIVADVLVHV